MTLLYTKNLNTKIEVTEITNRTYPEYSSVTCKLVRAGTDTPIPLKNIDFYVQGENTSKEEGEQYELLRTETTDKNGEVTFNVYLGSRYSGTFYQPRIKNYELQEHISQLPTDYKTSGYSTVNYNPYGTPLFDIQPGMTIPFKLVFDAGKSENATLDEYSSNTTYTLQSSSYENKDGLKWLKDTSTRLEFVRMVKTNNNGTFNTASMEASITHNLYVLYTDKNGVGIPNATLKCSINSGASLGGREFTQLNNTTGTVVTNEEGLAYISLNGKTGDTSTTLTVTSTIRDDSVKNNLYEGDKTATLNINWINRNTTYLTFNSISLFNTGSGMTISGTLHSNSSVNNQTISVKPYTVNSSGALVSAGSATSITTSSDGSFSYTHDTAESSKYTGTPLVYSLQVSGVTRYVVTHFFNRDILRWNPKLPLTTKQLLDGVSVMSDMGGQIQLFDGNGTPIKNAAINVEISHTRKSQETNGDTEKSKVYKIYTTIQTGDNGFAGLPFKDIQYAGTYVFKLRTNTRDGNLGVRTYKTQVKFTPIQTKLIDTGSVNEAPILSNGINIGRRLRDANDEPIGGGYITRTLTPKSQLTGITHTYDKTGVNIPANKTYTYPAVLTGSLGGLAAYFIAWSQPTTAKLHIAYDPAAYSDIYQPVTEDVTVTWNKATPTLTSTASTNNPKPLRATLKGEVITTFEAPVPPTYTNISTSNAKTQLGSTYVERNPDVTFIQVNEGNYTNDELNINNKPVQDIPIKSQITWDKTGVTAEYTNTGLTTQTVNTNNQGKITTSATPTNKGDVNGTFKFTAPESTLYSEANSNLTLEWEKVLTEISVGSFTGYAQLLNPQSVTATLYNSSDPNNKKPISNARVTAKIEFDSNEKINNEGYVFSSDLTTNSSGKVEYSFTPKTREITSGGITPRVYGAVTFTYDGTDDELYDSTTSYAESTYWEQIEPLYVEDTSVFLSDQPALWQCRAGVIVTYARENIVTHVIDYPVDVGAYEIGHTKTNTTHIIDYPILSGLDVEVTLSTHPGKNNTSTESLIQITGREANTDNTVEGQRYFTLTPQVTDKNGKVKAGFVSLSHGDVTGVFQFRNISNTIFLENYIRIPVYWKKRDMTLKVIQVYIDNKDQIDDKPVTSTTPVYLGSTRKVKLQLVDSLSYEDGRTVKITGVTVHKTVKWKTDNNTYLTYGQVRYQDDDGNSLDTSNPKSSWTSISNNSVSDDDGNTTVIAMVDRKSGVHIEYLLSIQNDNLYNNVEQTVETWSEDNNNNNPPYISYWNKIPTKFTLVSKTQTSNGANGELPLETTLPGSVQVRLNEDTSKTHRTEDYLGRLTGVKVTPNITWTNKNGGTLTKTVTGTNTTSNNGYTDNNREIKHTYTPNNIGDIKGTFTFTFNGNELYEETTSTGYEVIWNKIKTQIIQAKDVKVYNGRYTNLLSFTDNSGNVNIDWTTASPGANPNHANYDKTFEAYVGTYQTNTNIKYPVGEYVSYYQGSNLLFEIGTINNNGYAHGRWTKKYNENELNTKTFIVRFNETDLFLKSETTITYTPIHRIKTTLTKYTYQIYPPIDSKKSLYAEGECGEKFRYNVPFNFGTILQDEDNNFLSNQKIHTIFDRDGNALDDKGNITTNSNGIAQIQRYNVKDVRLASNKCIVEAKFDEEDLIDKYEPAKLTYCIEIEKDYTLLSMKIGAKVYTSCGNAEVTLKLVDSLERGISDKLWMYFDDGSYTTSPKWILAEDEGTNSDTNGDATYYAEAYSGIRLVKSIFRETWCYFSSYARDEIEYDITRTYTGTVVDGKVNIPIDCKLSTTTGLPEGLYDVKLEYIPPEAEEGKCILYSPSENFQPLRKKRYAELVCLTNQRTTEPGIPLFLTVQLRDVKGGVLPDQEVQSRIGLYYPSTPNHITDNEGKIVRGYVDNKTMYDNIYHFRYEQTRKYATAVLDVDTSTTKITPSLVPSSKNIKAVNTLPISVSATLSYQRTKYDNYGYEIRRTDEGKLLYHNILGKYDNEYPEYYYIENGKQVEIKEADYLKASAQIVTTNVKYKDIVWINNNRAELTRDETNTSGVASSNITFYVVGTRNITVNSYEDSTYFGVSEPITVETQQIRHPYFTGPSVKETIYNHSTELGVYLKYLDDNNVEQSVTNQEVTFTYNGTIIHTGKTDSNGFIKTTQIANTPNTLTFTATYTRPDNSTPYTSTSQSFTLQVKPQTPKIKVTLNKTQYSVDEKVTATIKLTEDEDTSKLISNAKIIVRAKDQKNTHDVGVVTTNNQGVASIQITPEIGGTLTVDAIYEGDETYAYATDGVTVSIAKLPTKLVYNSIRTESMGNDMYVTLYENKNNTQGSTVKYSKVSFYNRTNVTGNSNGTLLTSSETDVNGLAIGNGAVFYELEKFNIRAVFAGDDKYESCYTDFVMNITFLRDTCKDPSTWIVMNENWYGSDGSSSYGLDVNELNRENSYYSKFGHGSGISQYKWNNRPVNEGSDPSHDGYNKYSLRDYCDDVQKSYEMTSEGISAPTGVILKTKYIKTINGTCRITYQLKYDYDYVNEKTSGLYPITKEFGGHFGLINDTESTAEYAKVRFEVYRTNSYCLIENQIFQVWSESRQKYVDANNIYAYHFEPNTWYEVTLTVSTKKAVYSISPVYDSNGKLIEGEITFDFSKKSSVPNLADLHPYIFAFTNGTRLVIRDMLIEKLD